MRLDLRRRWATDVSTVGELYIDGERECFILEDARRPVKIPGATCIPEGVYPVRITHSPRFNVEMPLVCDVPGFAGVRIHPGNTAADTEGCLLPGRVRHGDAVLESRKAYVDLFARLQGASDDITLHVTYEPEVIEL